MDFYRELKEICQINAVSGREEPVREYLIQRLPEGTQYGVDPLGNLYVHKKGIQKGEKKVMIAAHMDEVGFIITSITEDGYLKFATLGGIDPAVAAGRVVTLESGICGVIGAKPVHLTSKEERKKSLNMDSFTIDIGAKSKEEAEEKVALGDYACFNSTWREFGENRLKMKALDNRMGCIMMLQLIEEELPYDTHFVFTVQEEVGSVGAAAAAFNVKPDIAIVLETTTAGDIAGTEGPERTCCLGQGPVISYMDRGAVYDNMLYVNTRKLAEERNIPWQTKTKIAGGNDSAAIQRSAGGARVLAISVPTRYLHSPSCVVDKRDVDLTLELSRELLKELATGKF